MLRGSGKPFLPGDAAFQFQAKETFEGVNAGTRMPPCDLAYRWIAGNVDVSHQKLSQFRVGYGEALNELMTNILATLMSQGLLSLVVVAQGGTRMRAATSRISVDVIVPPAETAKTIEETKTEGADTEVIAWREGMETDEARQLYRGRAGLAELANAHQKTHHGITQVLVRGAAKVTCVIFLNAIASNLLQRASHLLG
jgi:hypothetical protein